MTSANWLPISVNFFYTLVEQMDFLLPIGCISMNRAAITVDPHQISPQFDQYLTTNALINPLQLNIIHSRIKNSTISNR